MKRCMVDHDKQTVKLIALAILLVCVCFPLRSKTELIPIERAYRDTRVVKDTMGITLSILADAWTGNPRVRRHVTPLFFRFHNRSGFPVRIRYRYFYLAADTAHIFRALPLREIPGSLEGPNVSESFGLEIEPRRERFAIAPFDDEYYGRYFEYWARSGLPTDPMIYYALPEGILHDSGRVDGFLYFQKVPAGFGRIRLFASIVHAQSDSVIAQFTIPYLVR